MKESYEYAKSKGRKVELEDNKIGHILRINDRKSSNYYRVYSKNTFLEFELEIKNDALKSIQSIFFSNSLIEFEEKITRNFYRLYKNSLVLHNDCTDWLLDKLKNCKKGKTQIIIYSRVTCQILNYGLLLKRSVFSILFNSYRLFKIANVQN